MTNRGHSMKTPGHAAESARGIWDRYNMSLMVFDAENVPKQLAAEYAILFTTVFAGAHAYLNAPDMNAVLSPDNGLGLAISDGQVEAGLFFSRRSDAGSRRIKIMGLVSSGRVPAIAAPLVSAVALSEIKSGDTPVLARAVVRVMPDGQVNFASSRALARAGFAPATVDEDKIELSDVHLHLSAEPDGMSFRFLDMAASGRELLAASSVTLADWTERRANHV